MNDKKENRVKTAVIVMTAILVLMSMLPVMVCAQSDVKINEIMYDPPGTDADLKWIELYNNDITVINITGWKFYEADTNHSLTVVQGSMVIPVGGYAIIADNATAFLNEHPKCKCTVTDSTFSLRNSDEYIALKNATLDIVDEVTYNSSGGADGNGKTLERTATGSWVESLVDGGTPCAETGMRAPSVTRGNPIIVEEKQIGIAVITCPTTGDIKINEIMYDPSTEQGNDNKMEWIELYNNDTKAVNISGWTLNGREILDTIMQPEDYVVLAWNKTAVEAYYGDALTCPVIDITLQLVNKPGDTIVLKNRTGVEVDNVTYNSSLGADGNGKTLERTATGAWAESIVDGGTPCKQNSVAIVIPFSSWGPPVIYTWNITADAMNPENVGKNATTELFTTTEEIDNESYYVINTNKPTGSTKLYVGKDDVNEDDVRKRVVTEMEPGVEIVNLTFDPAFVNWDYPLWDGKTWNGTTDVTGMLVNESGSEILINSTAVVSAKVTAEVVTVPCGTFTCLVIETNISYVVAGQPTSNLEKSWISPTDNGYLTPKYQSYLNGAPVEGLELIEVIPPTFLNASDNNTTINVTTGEFLVVTFETASPGSTGYMWGVEELDEQVLRQLGDVVFVPDYVPEPGFTGGPPGKQIATFEVVGAGNATLNMDYRSPGGTVEDTFTLNVTAS